MEITWKTHEVTNQVSELENYNLFTTDAVLTAYFTKNKVEWANQKLVETGERIGTTFAYHQALVANQITPVLKAFDTRGNRKDFVEFHPAWHWFMQFCKKTGMISIPVGSDKKHRWPYFATTFMLLSQVEDGSMCPTIMTLGSIPLLQKEPKLWEILKDKLLSQEYDERDIPIAEKTSIWIGMGMTEKQGGSDVRSNTTVAFPMSKSGRGEAYQIRGHKWFFSAPMSDAHLVVARTSDTDSLACFFVPRWKLDGTKNPILIQQLKNKVGNKSNSSSEVEFQDAWGIMIGEEGRGIPTIIEMANYTRLACVLGASGIMRQATVQALYYARNRDVFGKKLYDQPLMRNVLIDFALTSEATQHLGLKLAEAFENGDTDLSSKAWKRIVTPAAKYWCCKRSESLTAEAMEVFGGNGYVEESVMARLFKEAPVNSIWEGSGNVMCLDVLRAINKEPKLVEILFAELSEISENNQYLVKALSHVTALLSNPQTLETQARTLTEKLILIVQACLLLKNAPSFVSDAFIKTRIEKPLSVHYGALDLETIEETKILERAFPLNFSMNINVEKK
ncbi:acyl-CoA dehydrogenase family protein [Myroides odoratus]|uniref:acyl-CoA dehydrogenase family protein n=1 Tax=Myroides odoratus TaxID=256 RepID=UPI0039B04678